MECAGGGATCTQPTCGLGLITQVASYSAPERKLTVGEREREIMTMRLRFHRWGRGETAEGSWGVFEKKSIERVPREERCASQMMKLR